MAGDPEIPYKEGYLWLPPHKKKLWQKKFCQLFCASKQGVDRLEIYDSEENASKVLSVPIVTLEDCIKITQDPQKTQPYVFTVVTKAKIHYFAGNSENDMNDWISAFQSVAFQDTASRQTIEEDNELYCYSGGDGVYRVVLIPTEASKRCSLSPGEYTLIVSPAALQLRQTRDNNLLFTWPYRYIRRYGVKKGRFTFEAGRKCISGEGNFDLEHRAPQDIFRTMSSRMAAMKQLLSSRDNLLGDSQSQFQHALGMNARSRSPLPPSPTSITPIPLPPRKPIRKNLAITACEPPQTDMAQLHSQEIDIRLDSGISVSMSNKSHASSTDHLEKCGLSISRKSLASSTDHLEKPDIPISKKAFTSSTDQLEKAGRVFSHEKTSSNYDKLNHFGTISKYPLDPSYSQINLNSEWGSPQVVEDHGGYGMIRKRSQTEQASPDDIDYAVICKPHRV